MGTCADRQNKSRHQDVLNEAFIEKTSLFFNIKTCGSKYSDLINQKNVTEDQKTLHFNKKSKGQRSSVELKLKSNCDKENFDLEGNKFHEYELKCLVESNNGNVAIKFPDIHGRNSIWKYANEEIQITENDVFRVGSTEYTLIQFVNQKANLKETIQISQRSISQDQQKKCRICYESSDSEQNPLISPCNCSGSMELVHMSCLKKWLFSYVKENKILRMRIQKSFCEVCKANITETSSYKSIIAKIFEGEHQIEAPYAILEGKQDSAAKGQVGLSDIIILTFHNKDQCTIGRDKEADIFDKNDTFMSKINTSLTHKNGKIFIKDRKSLNGTFIKLTKGIVLSKEKPTETIIYKNMMIEVNSNRR